MTPVGNVNAEPNATVNDPVWRSRSSTMMATPTRSGTLSGTTLVMFSVTGTSKLNPRAKFSVSTPDDSVQAVDGAAPDLSRLTVKSVALPDVALTLVLI